MSGARVPQPAPAAAASPGPDEGPWWKAYFDEAFLRLYRPFLPAERTWREVAGVVEMLDLEPEARLLDVPCGWGRHAVEFARLGYHVSALDLSETLLRQARRLAEEARVEVEWVRGDMRQLPWQDRFDAVVCLFSSLGYFLSDAEDVRALQAIRDALHPGGRLLLETMHRDAVAREFSERDWWEGDAGEHVWVEREFEPVSGVSHEWLRWRTPEGVTGEKYHAIRVRSATEWAALLASAGLEPVDWYGDWDMEPLALGSGRLVAVARRPG
jgi:SAM-dependent methyltransferase